VAFDVFGLRDRVVAEYREYFESFVNIRDERIEEFVKDLLDKGEAWPDAVLQLNPAFVKGASLGELASQGVIIPETARFFGPKFRLHKHQEDALRIALKGESYVVTTGTGSGKSWTYLIPLADHIFRNNPGNHSIRAVIVYPMNALINSQLKALEKLRDDNWDDTSLRFARYTGQENDEARDLVQQDPPHILLTNYMMLEYMLVRPAERALLTRTTKELRFLVVDEMHMYRGRQGADVAMLLRRVNEKADGKLMFIGTSATIATSAQRKERNQAIASVASTLFGTELKPENVVGETLERIAAGSTGTSGLAQSITLPAPAPSAEEVQDYPLTAWIEKTFGVDEVDGELVRQRPTTFREGVAKLATESGLPTPTCEDALKAVLEAGNEATLPSGDPVFAFRLHQFLASGRTVYASIEPADERELTVTAQYWAPGEEKKLLFPMAFCRECGQEYYLASLDEASATLQPRSPLITGGDDDTPGAAGYFAIDRENLWAGEEDIPDTWFDFLKSGPRLKKTYKNRVPQPFWASPDGTVGLHDTGSGVIGWWQPKPLLVCLSCRTVYETSMRSDFIKLSTLSQTGRSTATTITTASANLSMVGQGFDPGDAKVLSFTDNRQDASLQAGHLNDFVQIALLRGALARAVAEHGREWAEVNGPTASPHAAPGLTADQLGQKAFDALDFRPPEFMQEPVESGPGYVNSRRAMVNLLEYRAFEDLRRAWRVAQPNLEQTGLVLIGYDGLSELASDDALWQAVPGFRDIDGSHREQVLKTVLDHLRSRLIVGAGALTEEQIKNVRHGASEWLCEPWKIDSNEFLHRGAVALLPNPEGDAPYGTVTFSLGPQSGIARYLKLGRLWDGSHDLGTEEVSRLIDGMIEALRGHILRPVTYKGKAYGVQIIGGALRWQSGDGTAPPPDPVRFRQSQHRRDTEVNSDPNPFFAELYSSRAAELKRLRGKEHTAQVSVPQRIEREDAFREGRLPALFCSPTMELGIDISDLYVVHMRNVPRSPANYAQRSGRAGRGGKPALVLTFCSQGSAHDEHYFRRRWEMIAGSVLPARMDLANRELVEAHFHAVWLSCVGAGLGSSIPEFLDLLSDDQPLGAEFAAKLQLSSVQKAGVVQACRAIVGDQESAIQRADWYDAEWLEQLIEAAPQAFDAAMNRWRELYQGAWADLRRARATIDLRNLGKKIDRDVEAQAVARESEATRELRLLLNQASEKEDSDFYPYRYLASEGFLPGYNFPPQPLRALIPVGNGEVQTISRARFLALSEFGPRNVIYHEGQKNMVTWCLPTGEKLEERITKAKICSICGYIHPDPAAQSVDVCEHCGTRLEGPNYSYPQRLLSQPTVRTRRTARITSDEEERTRTGYNISTHYRFAPGRPPGRASVGNGDQKLFDVVYAPGATVYRINNGWRRSEKTTGFTLTLGTGDWRKPDDDSVEDRDEPAGSEGKTLTDVRPYVTDSRNILLVAPQFEEVASEGVSEGRVPARLREEAVLRTLLYALAVGIRLEYQIEEQEVAPEIVGSDNDRRILLWEAAEGGTGVWDRIMRDPTSFARIARQVLRACHFDPETGDALDDDAAKACSAACYECLLSYTNQRDHRLLDRFLIRDFLLSLTGSVAEKVSGGRAYDEQFGWLMAQTDPESSLERSFLEFLHVNHLNLPDLAQHKIAGMFVQPDFAYDRASLPEICVFIDGSAHEEPGQKAKDIEIRGQLEARGYPVIAIRPGDFGLQIETFPDVFGVLGESVGI
jgi:ATP-dependent helicase YprA (DUF1998 family)